MRWYSFCIGLHQSYADKTVAGCGSNGTAPVQTHLGFFQLDRVPHFSVDQKLIVPFGTTWFQQMYTFKLMQPHLECDKPTLAG